MCYNNAYYYIGGTGMNALVVNCSPVKNGATAEIVRIVAEELSDSFAVKSVCIDDYNFSFCRGCRSCHATAKCVQHDDIDLIMDDFERADVIVCVSPSYWADIPGQFKAFIDRCTPWCNTHEPHASLSSGKKGYAIALRTGPSMGECQRIIGSIEHFYGHLEIECCGSLGLCSIEYKEALEPHILELKDFCTKIKSPRN
jgi:multimeric flavodoxin WrbA